LGRYVIRRVLWVALVIAVVTMITFVIFYVMPPGDPAVRFAGRQPTPALIQQVRQQLGLDKPLYTQYWIFIKHIFKGDDCGWPGLGQSYQTHTCVKTEITARAPRTLSLAIGAAIVWLLMGIPIGIISALKRRSIADRMAMSFALFGISAPVFWLGLMFLFIFWQKLGLQALGSGYSNFTDDPVGWFTHLLGPWFVLALLYAAFYARMTRGNLIDTMGEDYIRTARAKGLPERKVIMKHGLRASLTPVVTMFGMDLALLVGGAVITETVFNIQGLGNWAVTSTFQSDLPAILGVTLVASFTVAFMNLFVDLLYAYLDPRVRYA
jgi:peptide/nickel transport system permease protein